MVVGVENLRDVEKVDVLRVQLEIAEARTRLEKREFRKREGIARAGKAQPAWNQERENKGAK
jgi:hypothetical protein